MKIYNVLHLSLLELYISNRRPQRIGPLLPEPVVSEAVTRYEIKMILDSSKHNGKLGYWVYWTGYPIEARSWMRASDLPDNDPLVIDFIRSNLISLDEEEFVENEVLPMLCHGHLLYIKENKWTRT